MSKPKECDHKLSAALLGAGLTFACALPAFATTPSIIPAPNDNLVAINFEQDADQKADTAMGSDAKLDLTFNSRSKEIEPGYLYFDQSHANTTTLNSNSIEDLRQTLKPEENFTPRFGESTEVIEALSVLGDDWLRNSFTPRQADAHLTFGYQPGDDKKDGSKLGVALSSSVKVEEVGLPGMESSQSLSEALNRQTYRIGLNVGYSGFNVGATFREDQSAYADTTRGYGVGLSYTGASWSTSLNVGEYSRKYRNVFGDFNDAQTNFYAFEFGASYKLNRSFRFSGGVRYLSFGDNRSYLFTPKPEAQIFYLGTNLSF